MKKQILIVEDEEELCDLLAEQIELIGFKVFRAYNAKKALSLISGESMDLVITDIQMPEMDGLELVEKIKSEGNREQRFYALTGFCSYTDIEIMEMGIEKLYLKPGDIGQLLSDVKTFL